MANKRTGTKGNAKRARLDRGVSALGDEIRALQAEDGSESVQARVLIGQKLEVVKGKLPHGEWLSFLSDEVGYAFRSAQRLIQFGEWADGNARLVAKVQHWGPTKVYHLMDAGPEVTRRLISRQSVAAPSSGKLKRLERLTARELKTLLDRLVVGAPLPLESEEKDEAEELMRTLKRDSARAIRAVNKLRDLNASAQMAGGVDEVALMKVHKRLLRTANTIEKLVAEG